MILGHQETSSDTSFLRFSAMSSIPSSVIFEHPDRERTVKFGKECTEKKYKKATAVMHTKLMKAYQYLQAHD